MRRDEWMHGLRGLAIAVAACGCVGTVDDPPGPGSVPREPPPGGCVGEACRDYEETPAPATRFARLTHDQWDRTVTDLFRLEEPIALAHAFHADPDVGAFDNDARRSSVTAGLWRDYQHAAEEVAAHVTSEPILSRWLPSDPPPSGEERARAFIERFGMRAYRRPLVETEIAALLALFARGAGLYDGLDAFTAGVRLVVQAALQSPSFVYRVEDSVAVSDGMIVLDGYEIASRLSYLLWNTMPDDELFAAASSGSLDGPDGVRAEIERMYAEPATAETIAHFHEQLFEMHGWTDVSKDATAFPDWSPDLARALREEGDRFLRYVVSSGGGVADLFTSRTAFVNGPVASLYGVDGVSGDAFQEVELPAERAGLLTRAGFLAKHGTLRDPDPIHRGVFVNLSVLCRPIAAPPSIPDELVFRGTTNRERIDSITGPGTCGEGCHGTIINPIGFAFESFDAIGRYRVEDNGEPVDDAAEYTFGDGRTIAYDGAVELSARLAEAPETHACYTRRVLEYALGHPYRPTEHAPLVFRTEEASLQHRSSIGDVIASIATSRAFLRRSVAELDEVSP